MTFDEWLQHGITQGWATDVVCQTHEGTPLNDEETKAFDDGDDPCVTVVRIWMDKANHE